MKMGGEMGKNMLQIREKYLDGFPESFDNIVITERSSTANGGNGNYVIRTSGARGWGAAGAELVPSTVWLTVPLLSSRLSFGSPLAHSRNSNWEPPAIWTGRGAQPRWSETKENPLAPLAQRRPSRPSSPRGAPAARRRIDCVTGCHSSPPPATHSKYTEVSLRVAGRHLSYRSGWPPRLRRGTPRSPARATARAVDRVESET